jgi:hypothetical protein
MHDGAPARFSRAVRDVHNNIRHGRWTSRGGHIARPPRSPNSNALEFYRWGNLRTLLCAAPVDNGEVLHRRIVDASHTIHNCPGIFERMQRFMLKRVEA